MAPQDHALLVAVQERIAKLIAYRAWDRKQSPLMRSVFADLNREYRAELRSLLRLRSEAKRASRQAEYELSKAQDARVETFFDMRWQMLLEEAEMGLA